MRNPYHVGRWVTGDHHYGRRMLLESLLNSRESATWLVGTRRLGKTSLLRQLELTVTQPVGEGENAGIDKAFLPVFWDLQGCETPDDLAYELDLALEDKRGQLAALGIDLDALPMNNAVAVLRTLARSTLERGVRVLLLIDEAEALLAVARNDARWLETLRKALLEGHMRTIMTSTRLLSQLNHLNATWRTSPFLFGIQTVQLWALGPEMAAALMRQAQGSGVCVDDDTAQQILAYCNGHPYLIQYLCERLFVNRDDQGGMLRPIEEPDLNIDDMLTGFFGIDFRGMTRLERRILLTLSVLTLASEGEILSALCDVPPSRIRMFLYSLSRLGYVRRIKSQWTVGNEFLRRWLREFHDELAQRVDSVLDEEEEEANLRQGAQNEIDRLHAKIQELEEELQTLEQQLRRAQEPQRSKLEARILAIHGALAGLRRDLERARQARHEDGA